MMLKNILRLALEYMKSALRVLYVVVFPLQGVIMAHPIEANASSVLCSLVSGPLFSLQDQWPSYLWG